MLKQLLLTYFWSIGDVVFKRSVKLQNILSNLQAHMLLPQVAFLCVLFLWPTFSCFCYGCLTGCCHWWLIRSGLLYFWTRSTLPSSLWVRLVPCRATLPRWRLFFYLLTHLCSAPPNAFAAQFCAAKASLGFSLLFSSVWASPRFLRLASLKKKGCMFRCEQKLIFMSNLFKQSHVFPRKAL